MGSRRPGKAKGLTSSALVSSAEEAAEAEPEEAEAEADVPPAEALASLRLFPSALASSA